MTCCDDDRPVSSTGGLGICCAAVPSAYDHGTCRHAPLPAGAPSWGLPMSTRTLTLSAAVLGLTLLLSGCNQPEEPESPDSPGGSASETASSASPSASTTAETPGSDGEYVEASADGPAQNVPKPEKSALADEESYEGAQAFLDYLADARAYAWQTGDTSLIREATSGACEVCTMEYDDIDYVYDSGGWATAGREEVRIIDQDMPVDSYGYPAPRAEVDYEGLTVWDFNGQITDEVDPISGQEDPIYFHLDHDGSGWILIQPTAIPV